METGIRFLATDADAVHADLAADGVDVDEVLRWPGVPPMFALRDADGNGMEIVENVDRQSFIDALKPLEPEFEKRFGKELLAQIRATP